jgi:hypothetical protein
MRGAAPFRIAAKRVCDFGDAEVFTGGKTGAACLAKL